MDADQEDEAVTEETQLDTTRSPDASSCTGLCCSDATEKAFQPTDKKTLSILTAKKRLS